MAAPIYSGGRPFIKGGIRTKLQVVGTTGTAMTLTKSQSNATFLFDVATNFTYTLPAAPTKGLVYTFLWTVLETGGQAHVVTAGAGVFLQGTVYTFSGEKVTPAVNVGPYQMAGDGTGHIKITMNGTTLGGGIGSKLVFTCLSATLWNVSGMINSPSGTIATPFST